MRQNENKPKIRCIAFAGGGSGGHSYPLLAVAAEIKRINPGVHVFFISVAGSVESRILDKSGVEYFLIPSGKLNGQSPLKVLFTACKLPLAFLKSAWIVLKQKPQFVMSAGGYAGAPFLAVAALMGVPCAVYEQNREPGMANRLMAKFARTIFINFPGTANFFSGKRSVIVGLPFRKEILRAKWDEADFTRKLEAKPFHIFVFGGSQGAIAINRLLVDALPYLRDIQAELFIHHQTGQNDLTTVEKGYAAAGFKNCKVESYVYDMASAYAAAHLVICRAGASSIVELAVAGKASVLVPLVSHDNHQEPNAQELAGIGASVLLMQQSASGEKLASIIKDFFRNREKIKSLSEKISTTYVKDSESKIIEEIGRIASVQ